MDQFLMKRKTSQKTLKFQWRLYKCKYLPKLITI